MKAFILGVALLAIACAQRTPVVAIPPGLQPSLSPAEAERFARDAVDRQNLIPPATHRSPDAVAITAIRGGYWIGPYEDGVTWIVEFEGHFTRAVGLRDFRSVETANGLLVMVSDWDPGVVDLVFVP